MCKRLVLTSVSHGPRATVLVSGGHRKFRTFLSACQRCLLGGAVLFTAGGNSGGTFLSVPARIHPSQGSRVQGGSEEEREGSLRENAGVTTVCKEAQGRPRPQ